MKQTYADVCLERAEKATSYRDTFTDVPNLARRLKIACIFLNGISNDLDDEGGLMLKGLVEALEAMPEEKK